MGLRNESRDVERSLSRKGHRLTLQSKPPGLQGDGEALHVLYLNEKQYAILEALLNSLRDLDRPCHVFRFLMDQAPGW
jgi:hypothetical protein